MTTQIIRKPCPKVGELFELTFDGSAPENQPREMINRYCRENSWMKFNTPDKWTHIGHIVSGLQTRRFKLVTIGPQPDFQSALSELARHGKIPEGQWSKAFNDTFESDKSCTVLFADPSWIHCDEGPRLPCIYPVINYLGFDWTSLPFNDDLWVVEY